MSPSLPSVSPHAYENKLLYPTPTHEMNQAWRELISAAHNGEEYMQITADYAENTGIPSTNTNSSTIEASKAGESARGEMWQANLPLVDFFIDPSRPHFGKGAKPINAKVLNLRTYVADALQLHPTLDLEDVRQWGRIGLLEAIERWEPERAKLAGAVYEAVRLNVQRGFMNEGRTIRIKSPATASPGTVCEKRLEAYLSKLEGGYSDKLEALYQHPFYPQTVTTSLQEIPDVESLALDVYQHRYIPDNEIGLTPEHDVLAPSWSDEAGLTYSYSKEYIDQVLQELSDQEKTVIQSYFGLDDRGPRSLNNIGAELGLTHQRISQVKSKALAKLCKLIGAAEPTDTEHAASPASSRKCSVSKLDKPDPRIAESAESLMIPLQPLPDLPKFSLSEKKLGMPHQEWLNQALEHIYSVWYDARRDGYNIRFVHIIKTLGNSSILHAINSRTELITNDGRHGETTISRGCLTAQGVQTVMEAYCKRQMSTVTYQRNQQRQQPQPESSD